MKEKIILSILVISVVIAGVIVFNQENHKDSVKKNKKLTATVMKIENNQVTVQDSNNIIYTFSVEDTELSLGDTINLEYKGSINKNKSKQENKVISYQEEKEKTDEDGVPISWKDDGIFSDFYILATKKLKNMTLDEKIAQLLLVRYPENNATEILKENQFAGYLFFAKDFKDKTKEEVINMISSLQQVSKIPILTAVDEEGGIVVRVSSNKNLRKERFQSPRDLYLEGGMDRIKEDTKEKSALLKELGLNLNLAPVVDVSTNPDDYMYERTLGENTELTSIYAKTVIDASKNTGVSYTLKHFPGYGNNTDTHTGTAVDNRTYEDIIENDLPPFQAGINSKAEAVLVSHNVVNSIDPDNPASLSSNIHNLLRNKLNFTGIIMTDDLDMGAITSTDDATVKAILAGNDLIITTDYEKSIKEIKEAIENKIIDESLIDKLAFRVIAWKYYKGLLFEQQK